MLRSKHASSLIIPILFLAGVVWAEEFPTPSADYSADLLVKVWTGQGDAMVRGKVYASRGRERRELGSPGEEVVSIVDRNSGTSFVLLPGQNMYMEQHSLHNRGKRDDPAGGWYGADVNLVFVGEEQVNGVATRKYRVSTVERAGGGASAGTAWLSAQNIPIRLQGSSTSYGTSVGFQIDHRNLRVEKQHASLFQVPSDYRRIDVAGAPPSMRPLEEGLSSPATSSEPSVPSDIQRQVEEMERQLAR